MKEWRWLAGGRGASGGYMDQVRRAAAMWLCTTMTKFCADQIKTGLAGDSALVGHRLETLGGRVGSVKTYPEVRPLR